MKNSFTTAKGLSLIFSAFVLVLQTLILACNIVSNNPIVEEPA